MMQYLKWFAGIPAILLSVFSAEATVVLPRVIGSNMVLQREKPVPVWGWAAAGEKVTVTFAGQLKAATANDSGRWQILLAPMQANEKPAVMTISGSNMIRLENILVGEVWLCSGQSNMEYSMRKNSKVTLPPGGADWPVNELDSAHDAGIRIFLADKRTLAKMDSTHKSWTTAEGNALRSFSAVGYFFGKKLRRELHVPIGIISSAVPGSRIEPWVPVAAFAASPFFKNDHVDGEPGKFYEPMIAPLQPFALRGFLWYQGESNCFLGETVSYTHKMQVLIDTWRSAWSDNKLPFYYVQIAPFRYSASKGKVVLTETSLPEFREAQAAVLQAEPHTEMVATDDLNDSLDNLHPHYKWEIGRRLALVALNRDYGKNDIVYSGPVFRQMKVTGNTASLTFSNTGIGLMSKNGQHLSWFEVAGTDGKFVSAEAVIDGKDQVIVSAKSVKVPVAVRFGWNEAAHPNLYNQEGLPALQFTTVGKVR